MKGYKYYNYIRIHKYMYKSSAIIPGRSRVSDTDIRGPKNKLLLKQPPTSQKNINYFH